jgi:hypothetical protein
VATAQYVMYVQYMYTKDDDTDIEDCTPEVFHVIGVLCSCPHRELKRKSSRLGLGALTKRLASQMLVLVLAGFSKKLPPLLR